MKAEVASEGSDQTALKLRSLTIDFSCHQCQVVGSY